MRSSSVSATPNHFANVAAYWCMFGIVGQVVTDVPAAMQRRPAQTLADALPNVATWWVPEHPISFGLVIGLGVLGFFLSIKGKRFDFHPEVTH